MYEQLDPRNWPMEERALRKHFRRINPRLKKRYGCTLRLDQCFVKGAPDELSPIIAICSEEAITKNSPVWKALRLASPYPFTVDSPHRA